MPVEPEEKLIPVNTEPLESATGQAPSDKGTEKGTEKGRDQTPSSGMEGGGTTPAVVGVTPWTSPTVVGGTPSASTAVVGGVRRAELRPRPRSPTGNARGRGELYYGPSSTESKPEGVIRFPSFSSDSEGDPENDLEGVVKERIQRVPQRVEEIREEILSSQDPQEVINCPSSPSCKSEVSSSGHDSEALLVEYTEWLLDEFLSLIHI